MLRTITGARRCERDRREVHDRAHAQIGEPPGDRLRGFGGNGDHADVAFAFANDAFDVVDAFHRDVLPALTDHHGRLSKIAAMRNRDSRAVINVAKAWPR